MWVIRKKSNHVCLKAYGHVVDVSGLGDFDPDVYEGVELDVLPEGAFIEAEEGTP